MSASILMISGVYLALGLIYLRFWWSERARLAFLAFTVSCLSYGVFAWFEFGMMRSTTPEEYLSDAWWAFIVGGAGIVAFAWFAYLHLHGRKWLFAIYAAIRGLALVLHLFMQNGINFRGITAIGKRSILGETLSYPIPDPNPWMVLPHLSHVVLIILFLDASVRCWRRGERRTAWIFGTATVLFGTSTLIVPTSVLWGLAPIPLFGSYSVLFIVAAMLYELNYDMHRSAMLGEKLKERDARLTETLDQLQLAAAAGNVGMWIRSIDGEIIWASEKAGEIWGFPSGVQFNQDDLIEKLHPDDHERVMECVRDLAAGKEEYRIEFRILANDGDIRWIQSQGRIETVDTDQIVRGALVDITDLKTVEAALQESESFNRIVLSSLNTHVCVLDRDGRILAVNHSWAVFATDNGSVSEATVGPGVNYLDVCRRAVSGGETLAQSAMDGVRAVCDGTQEYFQLEYPCDSPDEKRWFLMMVTPLKGSNRGAVVVHNDITATKLAAEAVRESEERFRNMAETAPVMIWMSDEKQATTYVNKRWLEFSGRTLEQELGDVWSKYIHPDDLDQTVERNLAAFEKRAPFDVEFRVRRTDGEYRWVFTTGTPRFSSENEFLGYIGTSIDITDRKIAESELKQAHKELKKLKDQLEAENIYLQEELRQDQAFGDIVGRSSAIKNVLAMISQVAGIDTTVLITGETGTGKELVARAVHDASERKDRPLIKVNCAALSPSLIESELFGHEKGAFTGASAKKLGRFELANTGTLLLDEIGELPLNLQSKLLRVLQEGEFERVGGSNTIRTDVRVLASTNRELRSDVETGRFREDLWYRLNVFPIIIPPLRDRQEDIPILTEHFARTFAQKMGKAVTAISPEAMSKLCAYSWPGNVRELANVIERAVINLRGTVLKINEDFELRTGDAPATSFETLEDLERLHIRRALERLDWRIDGPKGVARVLGVNPSTLRSRMGKLGIRRPDGSNGSTY